MNYRSLGRSGLQVSVIGLGTNQFGGKVDQAGVNEIIDGALDLGINFIDTADVYQQGRSETALGVALKGKWERVVLATKAFFPTGDGPNDKGVSRYHLVNAVEASLRRLQSDHIDLYQMHRWDDATPIEETLRALDDLVRSGKVRYVGASNYMAWQLARANLLAEFNHWTPFVSIQNHYHMFEREQESEMIPFCNAHNIGILPFFPLAGGFLTGKYKRGEGAPAGSRGESSPYVQAYMTDANFDKLEALEAWSAARSRTLGELAHAWLLAQPQVSSVISGATKLAHVQSNVTGANWALTAEELAEVNAILG
ncbi:MAG: aldo/keto reductase [Caldilinea sp.]|nr:aldo/keto reductase [Caldilineaceae bacterium]MCB9122257.1 aldo/keto reductase [Caldilineaceae bacterium]MCO5212410.1 aldo/keto reductase [Caldilinea sp.]